MNNNNETPMTGETPNSNKPIAQPATDFPNNSSKKKMWVIIGCSIGVIAIIALIVVLLIIPLKNNEEKVVSCTLKNKVMDIAVTGDTNIKIRTGEISSGNMVINVDLKAMPDVYKNYEKSIIDGITKSYKQHCKDHCTFNHDYIEGESAKYTMEYAKEGVSEIVQTIDIEGMSAQEIADKIQAALQDANTTCTQR